MKRYFITYSNQPGAYQFLTAGIKADYKAHREAREISLYPFGPGVISLNRAEYYKKEVLNEYKEEDVAIIAAFNGENNLVHFTTVGTYAADCTLYREYTEKGFLYPRFGLLLKNEWDFNILPFSMGKIGYAPCPEWEEAWSAGSYGRIPHEEGMENRLIQVYVD